jgi:excisionase family DNA binding protein
VTATDALQGAIVDLIERAVAALVEREGPRAYSAAEVGERLGVSDDTVYRLVQAGQLRPVPHLSPMRISAAALAAFMRGES